MSGTGAGSPPVQRIRNVGPDVSGRGGTASGAWPDGMRPEGGIAYDSGAVYRYYRPVTTACPISVLVMATVVLRQEKAPGSGLYNLK